MSFDNQPTIDGRLYMFSEGTKERISQAVAKMQEEFEVDALQRGKELISFSIRSMGVPSNMLGERERGITISVREPLPYAALSFNPTRYVMEESCLKYSPHKFFYGRYVNFDDFVLHARQCGKSTLRARYLEDLYKGIGLTN